MLYKHWKKIVLALTGFFWASCDETASGPVTVNGETPSSTITETEGASSSSKAKSAASSAEEASEDSSAEEAGKSSSSTAKSAASSAEEASGKSSAKESGKSSSSKTNNAESSAEEASDDPNAESAASNTTNPGTDTTSTTKSSSSVKEHRSSNSNLLDEPVDLYGCPSDICGPFITDSVSISDSISIIAAKYGVILPESSSSLTQIIAKYGVPSKPTCEPTKSKDGTVTYECSDSVTCVEETKTEMQAPACNGDVCPKYGVVKISKKTYTCDNGQVYNEAEFQMLYDTLPVIEEVVVHKDSIQVPIALYGPPCVFNGTCDNEN